MSKTKSPFAVSARNTTSGSGNLVNSVSPHAGGCQTLIQFPPDLIRDIRFHVVTNGLSVRELIRTVLEQWTSTNTKDPQKVKEGTIELTPAEDRRSQKGSNSVPEDVVSVNIYLSLECHTLLKQVAAGKDATLRGVIIAILEEWNDQEPKESD